MDDIMSKLIQILMATTGSVAFNIMFNIHGRKLIFASLGGAISWIVFLLLEPIFPNEAIRYFLSTATVTVYGEIFARIEKTPTTTFLVPSIIPLIPGSSLYYTMQFALRKDWSNFATRGFSTLQLALALAVGIISVTTLVRLCTIVIRKLKKADFFSYFH